MVKNKHNRALFEVITGSGSAPTRVPGRAGRSQPERPITKTSSPDTPIGQAVQIRDGRLVISVSPVFATVAVVAVIVALVGAFSAGRLSAGPDQSAIAGSAVRNDLAATRQSQADGSALRRVFKGPNAPADQPQPAGVGGAQAKTTLVPGKNYLVVQEFKSTNYEDAVKTQAFLADQSIATVISAEGGGYRLYSARAFDMPNERQTLDEFKRSIERYGRVYASNKYRGGYKFEGCYLKRYSG